MSKLAEGIWKRVDKVRQEGNLFDVQDFVNRVLIKYKGDDDVDWLGMGKVALLSVRKVPEMDFMYVHLYTGG
jgi:hypothetical protein